MENTVPAYFLIHMFSGYDLRVGKINNIHPLADKNLRGAKKKLENSAK